MGKRGLVVLLNLSSWCLVMVEWLFLAVPWDCLRFVIVLFPDHTHLLFLLDIFAAMYVTSCVFLTFCLYFSYILYSSFLKQKKHLSLQRKSLAIDYGVMGGSVGTKYWALKHLGCNYVL